MLDRIARKIREEAPEHLNGYFNGWLEIQTVFVQGNEFRHVFTTEEDGTKRIITTVIIPAPLEEDE